VRGCRDCAGGDGLRLRRLQDAAVSGSGDFKPTASSPSAPPARESRHVMVRVRSVGQTSADYVYRLDDLRVSRHG
jgi:hypothetical protein